jgi:DnaK suppressor protein
VRAVVAKMKKSAVTKKPAQKAPAKKAVVKVASKKAPAKKAPAKKHAVEKKELSAVEIEMDALIRESGEGAGDDQVDAGTKTFEREHEMSLVINARDMVLQTERALSRIDEKTYGRCEECGNSIGKARLQVFPRATLCMVCKQKEERR